MGRNKIVTEDKILDAAEKVIAKVGPMGLTLNAVALEAQIGKATVVYDFKNKHGLITALVQRAIKNDNNFNNDFIDKIKNEKNSVILGRIDAAQSPFPESFKDVALNLCTALAQDESLRKMIQQNQNETITTVLNTASNHKKARLAYLALEGLKLLESLDYYHWSDTERSEIINDIRSLVDDES